MKKTAFILTIFCFSTFLLHNPCLAQQFKWVTGGGTTEDLSTYGSREWEQTKFICTDPNGNIYALSIVGNNSIYADTFYRATGAYGASNNLLITSYTCNGVMRWAKLLGSSSASSFPFGISADNSGHIYIAGEFGGSGGTFYIGSDTSFSSGHLMTGLIQFDTSGHFNWIRYIGINTFACEILLGSLADPIAIDGSNNLHYFCYMESGVPLLTGTSSYGVYDYTYNSSGTLLSTVRLAMDSAWYVHGAVIDPATNKLYVYGEINQSIYGGTTTDSFYAAAFSPSRSLLWQYFCGHGDDDGLEGIVMDQSKHLYFCGGAQPGIDPSPTFSFNGDSVSAPYDDIAIVMKTDTNGHVNWIKHYDSHTAVDLFRGITLMPNYKVAAAGMFAGTLTYGTNTLSIPSGDGYSPYFVVLDSGGDLEIIQQIFGDGLYNFGNVITSDKVGNIYIGGQVVDSVWAGSPAIPAYHTVGGNSDFFVMKYGVDCSCTSSPIASYTDTGTHTIGVTYTGTTTGLDSIVWNFEDGHTAAGTPALHTYSLSGTYHVCVTVYTTCGSDIHCSNVTIEIPSENSTAITVGNVKVYPNPVTNELNITCITETTHFQLMNVTGENILDGELELGNNVISMIKIVPGIYILELISEEGERNFIRIIKE